MMTGPDMETPNATDLFVWWCDYCSMQEAFREADDNKDIAALDRLHDDWEDLKIDAAYLLGALLKDPAIRHDLLGRLET